MMEELLRSFLGHLQSLSLSFGPTGRYGGLPSRFKRAILSADLKTIALAANCMDWAKHSCPTKLKRLLEITSHLQKQIPFTAAKSKMFSDTPENISRAL